MPGCSPGVQDVKDWRENSYDMGPLSLVLHHRGFYHMNTYTGMVWYLVYSLTPTLRQIDDKLREKPEIWRERWQMGLHRMLRMFDDVMRIWISACSTTRTSPRWKSWKISRLAFRKKWCGSSSSNQIITTKHPSSVTSQRHFNLSPVLSGGLNSRRNFDYQPTSVALTWCWEAETSTHSTQQDS